jgi:hypothetical protein
MKVWVNMKQYCRIYLKVAVMVLIPVLILSGCAAPVSSVQPATETQTPASPTAEETTAAQPAYDESRAGLNIVESRAQVFGSANTLTEILKDQPVNIQVDDRIELDEQSRGILGFPNVLDVELFRNSIVVLAEEKSQSGGSAAVTLKLLKGHLFLRQNGKTTSEVTVETPFSTITTREEGTEFDVCYNEDLTCVLVKKGMVEVTANEKKEIIKAGEAGYVLENELPSSPICAPTEIFVEWEQNYRKSMDAPTLGKMISDLPQEPCATQNLDVPAYARILYEDDFTNPFSGWSKGIIDNVSVNYSAGGYYQVQVQAADSRYPVSVPNKSTYEDVNIDLKVSTKAERDFDFRYGVVFRRSGDQYYAFTITPRTKQWYVLKSSSNALEILREGTEDGIQGLEAEDTLRVAAKGSNFFFRINGQLVYQISDDDYSEGEVGLFVQTRDSSEALINIDSITIWDTQPPFIDPPLISNENCFNNKDDDGDHLIDKADPNCLIKDGIATATPIPNTLIPDTNTPQPPPPNTNTPKPPPPDTNTPVPPTDTDTPIPDTPIPDTPIPDTPIPDTPIPDTPIPDTPIPDTPVS